MMKGIYFSVVMSVYEKDNAIYLDRALESITFSQTIMPNEIVLVEDGNIPEDLRKVIEKYKNIFPFFKVIKMPENRGLGNALRIAVKNSSFEWIARMDSDDISVPDRFEQQIKFIEANSYIDIVGGDITEFINKEEKIVGKRGVPKSDLEIKNYMKKRCGMNHVTVMYRKMAVIEAGNYRDWFWNEDYYLWIRMIERGSKFGNTGTTLVNVRVGEEMYRRRGGIKYFISEIGIQKIMLQKKMISFSRYMFNIGERFILQVVMPNRIRGIIFRTFARTKG